MTVGFRSSLQAVFLFLCFPMGCVHDSGFGRAHKQSEPGVVDIELSIDIALQRSKWGESLGRCHLQAALRTFEPKEEEMVPYGESEGSRVVLPQTPDTCVHTVLTDPGPPVEPQSEEDNWQIAGEDVAADTIVLRSDQQIIVLEQVLLEGGMIRYEWSDCTEENFPFSQVFDLEMEDDPGLEVPGFIVEGAFAVGPDFSFVGITGDPYFHPQEEDLEVVWTEHQEWPMIRGESMDVDRTVWARNRAMDDPMPFEALACSPTDTRMVVGAQDWAQLEANEDEFDETSLVGIQVDTVTISPPFDAPWGQTISIRSTVSDGGDLHLYASP
jgi:hypothetical protein